jgi:AraC-like DNA-binding protein
MEPKGRIVHTARQHIYIPANSRERFLNVPPPSEPYLSNHDISWAGISDLASGYKAERKNILTHLILYTVGGSATLKIRHQPECALTAGDIFIAPTPSEYTYQTSRHWDILWIHLNAGSKWDKLVGSTPHVRRAAWGEDIRREMETYLRETVRRRADSGRALHSYADLIVLYLQRELSEDAQDQHNIRCAMEQVWSEVQHRIHYKWSIDELAQLAHMSRASFQRSVKQQTGVSPIRMVHTLKMEHAGAMLLYTDYSLEAIAQAVGYEDQFSFSKAFKRYSGMSPGQFKNQKTNP